jgi:hypothetical protein
MGYVPEGARWYVADIVLELTIEDEARNVVHVNTLLVEADSPEQAYTRAVELGQQAESDYENTDGKLVRTRFRGLRQLNVVHDELEHGAELLYTESVGVPEATLREWARPKERLGVFAPIPPRRVDRPNYLSEEVMRLLEAKGFQRDDLPE